MTADELSREWRHIYDTRLAILEAPTPPTPAQDNLARDEADRAFDLLSRRTP